MNKIILYTSLYPYTKAAEAFLNTEIPIAEKLGYDITIVPVRNDVVRRNVPSTVSVDVSLKERGVGGKILAFGGMFFRGLIVKELQETDKPRSLSNWRDFFKYLYGISLVYNDLRKRASVAESCVFYSYWMTFIPAAFAFYKQHHPSTNHHFITRGHGSDVYATLVGDYLPLRNYMMDRIDAVYTVSEYGSEFLKRQFPNAQEKISVSRLGVLDNNVDVSSNKDDDVIRLVSCAFMVPLKRIPLLYQSIRDFAKAHGDRKIVWRHFGVGVEYNRLIQQITDDIVLENYAVELVGEKNNEEILFDYRTHRYDCFLSISTSEGIPVSMMEAISSSIPIVATNVGGVKEIVTSDTGRLLDVNFTQSDFDEALWDVISRNNILSKSAHDYYEKHYNANNNYKNFYKSISQ